MKEIWKDIKGYKGIYQVSNLGRIKALERKSIQPFTKSSCLYKEKILKPYILDKRYFRIHLKKRRFFVHFLIASAFIKNKYNKKQINHIDGNKFNNNFKNLEWCTASENIRHAYKNGLIVAVRGEKKTSSKLTEKYILKIRSIKNKSHREIGNMFNVSHRTIGCILRRETWKHV